MSDMRIGVAAIVVLGFAACSSSPGSRSENSADIISDSFPEAQAAIRANKEAIIEAAKNRDWEALRSYHLESPKFTKFGAEDVRLDFEEMIAGEIASVSALLDAMPDVAAEFRDLKIDVFGDTAVDTAFLVITGTLPNGVKMETKLRTTGVWVRTTEGWKIAHEHNTPAPDIIHDSFPEAQAAIRAEMLALNDIGPNLDFDALRAAHLQSPKFSDFGDGLERHDFDQMIAAEIAAVSVLKDLSIDFRDLKIDVFGDVAIATSFPHYAWTNEDGKRDGMNRRATMVYVKTADGWKIAHENLSALESE